MATLIHRCELRGNRCRFCHRTPEERAADEFDEDRDYELRHDK